MSRQKRGQACLLSTPLTFPYELLESFLDGSIEKGNDQYDDSE